MKKSKLLYIISIIITVAITLIVFILLPKSVEIGNTTKPSFYLILLSLLPIFSTMLCMEAKNYKGLGYFLYLLIYFILLKILLEQFGFIIPMPLVGGFALTIGSFLLALHLTKVKNKSKIAINLAWIKSEDSYIAVQQKGAKVFFVYSVLQALALILHLATIISLNLAFIIPLVAFALSIVVMLKRSIKLE